jgi:hypothetical protein
VIDPKHPEGFRKRNMFVTIPENLLTKENKWQ